MSNANRDYAIVYDVKNSSLVLSRPLNFYITDKNTSNIFIKLVTRVIVGNGIDQYTDIENASNYVLTMRVIKPNNEVKSLEAAQHEPENIFQFDLTEDFKDIPGKYICELTISTTVSGRQELITSDPFNYEVKRSILSNIGEIIETEDTTVEKLLNDLEVTKAEISSQIKDIKNKFNANEIKLEDANNNYTSENVEGALEEISSKINTIETNTYDDTEIRQDINNIKTEIGSSTLTTTDKTIKGALEEINSQIKNIESQGYDDTQIRQDISDIKLQIGTEELTTSSKKIKGAINDLNSQIKNTENLISNMKYYVTPEMFGAKGDGVTDDFSAFQTAFDSGYNVICGKGKVYNLIGGIVRVDGNTNRTLDLNNSTIVDACFAYNLKEDFSDWKLGYCANSFTIKNGNIGSLSKAREHSKECVFLTGGFLKLKDLCIQRTPHLVAHINRFIDNFIMENVTNHAWADKAEDFKGLDCVNVFDRATGQIVKSSPSKYSQGDGWLFTKVNEFHSDFDENYNLVTCNFHQSIKFSMCIQSAICFGCRNIAIVEGCHFESINCKISFSTNYLNDSNILIKGCAFIANYEILDHICVTYQNCKFHLGYEIQKKWSQFFSKRLIEYTCKFIRCSTNELGVIDNYTNYVLWNTPIICNQSGWWLDELNKINCSFVENDLYKGSLDPLGEYNITMYLHLSNDLSQAYMKKEFTINKTVQSSALSISTFPLDGGILEIYVTNPNGEKRVGWIRIPNIHNSTQLGSNSYRYNQIIIMNDMITLKNQNPHDIVYDTMTVVNSIPDRVISSAISK